MGRRLGGQRAEHAEAIHHGNLHVQEHQLRLEPLDGRKGLRAVGALAHHFDVGLLLEQRQHALARHWLVVHDQSAYLRHGSAPRGRRLSARMTDLDGSGFL
jgi:hypothetical protein